MAAKAKGKSDGELTLSFTKERETKGTFVYAEDEEENFAVGKLYIRKPAAAKLGDPENITVIIKAD